MGDVDNIICAIVPNRYYDGIPYERSKYIKLIKKDGIDDAIKKAKPKPVFQNRLEYDSATETLEPLYFWILDFLNKTFDYKVEKLVDTFASSPGSGHFSELQGKASQMQQEASRVLGTVNTILKGVLNLIYDLKEFKIRLSHYDEANSKDRSRKEAGLLALKQIWMDKVDIQRGQGSLNAMASGNLQFVTLRDAFMMVDSVESVDKLDLNDRVKRVLKPRVQEFFEWRKRSEQELRKRMEIEKIYLKSQVDALKLNSRWAKPYLKAAEKLRQNDTLSSNPAMVTVFNTVLMQLTLMAMMPIKVDESVIDKDLPQDFAKMKNLRKYSGVVIVDFYFRGIPNRQGQHYTMGGRAEATFKGYALNEDEIKYLKAKLAEGDMDDALRLVEGMTDDSLGQLKVDLKDLLGDENEEEKKESQDLNPFSVLFDVFKPSKKDKKKDKKKEDKIDDLYKKLKKDNYAEAYIRNFAEAIAANMGFTVYDTYKKAHGMADFPYTYTLDREASPPQTTGDRMFGFK